MCFCTFENVKKDDFVLLKMDFFWNFNSLCDPWDDVLEYWGDPWKDSWGGDPWKNSFWDPGGDSCDPWDPKEESCDPWDVQEYWEDPWKDSLWDPEGDSCDPWDEYWGDPWRDSWGDPWGDINLKFGNKNWNFNGSVGKIVGERFSNVFSNHILF